MKGSGKVVRIRIPRRARAGGPTRSGRKRGLYAMLAAILFLGLAAAHVVYWYLPRLRPARPSPGLLPARLLASEELPFAVWLPFPHQNLAVLDEITAPERANSDLMGAVARLAQVPQVTLPAFGSLRVPPSREITFASDEDGERFAVAAEVYPAVAAFAKLAGRLANNLWLRGGRLTVDGREVEVAWHGRVWTVSSPGFPALGTAGSEATGPPSVLVAEVRDAEPPLPSGRFHLTRQGDDLVLASAGAPDGGLAFEGPELSEMGLFLLVISGGDRDRGEPMQAMAFFNRDDPLQFSKEGVRYEFPGMASVYETGADRWTLPGESLLKWSGRKARRTDLGRFSVAALDRQSFRRIQRLAPRFAPLARPRPEGRLRWGLWFDLESGVGEIARIARALEEIPIVSRQRRQRWRDAATVLAPAARAFSRVSLVVTDEPTTLHLRFVGR